MGLFGSSKYNKLEQDLVNLYSQIFTESMGMNPSDAKEQAEDMLDQAIADSKKERTDDLPQNTGDIILGESGLDDPKIKLIVNKSKKMLQSRRKEGVTDEDIRYWWNLHDLERRMMIKHDDIARMALFIDQKQKGINADEAAVKVRKLHPMYGDPSDTKHSKGNDRPLPYELKDRINKYIENIRKSGDHEKYKKEIDKSSSFNALVRKKIKTGEI